MAGNGRTHGAVDAIHLTSTYGMFAFLLGRGVHDWAFGSERVLQTYELPAAAFLAANPDLDLSNITAVDVTFDGRIAGAVLIDELGFRK